MILLFDADSLIWSSCYKKRENPEDSPYHDNLEDATAKFDQVFMSIINKLEESYDVDRVVVFSGSLGNFRKLITPKYKANRINTPKPILLQDMHDWVKENYNSLYGHGIETDDLVAKYWYELSKEVGRDNVMIISIDKDYKQFPCLMYNYHQKHQVVYDITEEEAMFNFYEQMIIGDTADNVNYIKGKGKKFAEKYLADCNTKYQYTKKMYQLFKDIYKGKAKQRYVECYNLLKLRTEF